MKRLSITLIVCLLATTAFAQSSKQSSKEKLEKEIELLDKKLKENENKSSSAQKSLKLASRKVSASKKLVEESNKEIKAIDSKVSEKEGEIQLLDTRIDTLSLYFNRLVRNAYINRDGRVWFMYLLSSDNLSQGLKRFGYFRSLSGKMNSLARNLKEAKAALEVEKNELINLRRQAESIRNSQQQQLNKLKAAENQSRKLVNQLSRNKAKYQKELAAKKRQIEALNRELNKMIGQKTGKNAKPVDTKLSGEFSANKGKLPWPVSNGSVVETFGQHYHPVYKSVKLPFNNGINIATAAGAEVKSVFNGEVKQVIVMPGYNQCVLVQHGEYFTFYCKLGSVRVKAGEKVKTGQVLGKVEAIGGETELHFQLWEGRSPKDPELWLR